ncbi:LPXTG cell wall anchor domain-containing protein [Streptomyces sp. NBC_00582]|uniref:LPXTG cell wall anchor domain-containing protein n=1 Tax=Streptomyces sp. NBC_00582 TaxID=2975783 RepID=UPI003FCEBD5C
MHLRARLHVPPPALGGRPGEAPGPLLLGTDNAPPAPAGDELPKTGVGQDLLPLGATGAFLLVAGAAGPWWARRRPQN